MSGARTARGSARRRASLVASLLALPACFTDVSLGEINRAPPATPDAAVPAAPCASADIQAALDVARDGDTVRIPAGNCDWSTPVRLEAGARNLRLLGAGVGVTVIRAQTSRALDISAGEGVAWEFGGVTFTGGTGDTIVGISGASRSWRLHDVEFSPGGGLLRLIRINGATYGVIDNVRASGSAPAEFVTVEGDGWLAWQRPLDLGTADAVYIEDCSVAWAADCQGCAVVDVINGGRAVLRRNRITNAMPAALGFDNGYHASALLLEVYANDFALTTPVAAWARLAQILGGTGVVFDNTWTVDADVWVSSPAIALTVTRAPGSGSATGWLACDGSPIGICSNVDSAWRVVSGDRPFTCHGDADCPAGTGCAWRLCSGARTTLCQSDPECPAGETCTAYVDGLAPGGYPCFHQPGFGPWMQSRPLHEWNNQIVGSANVRDPDVDFVSETAPVVAGRDYHDDTPLPGYTPYAYPHPLRGAR